MNTLKKITNIAIIVVVLVAAALWLMHSNQQDNRRTEARRQNRILENQSAVPSSKSYKVNDGEVMVLDIPYPMEGLPQLQETQKCFVWRDSNGSSISCPTPPTMIME